MTSTLDGHPIDGIVFDWSGVLADEIEAVAQAHASAIAALGGRPLTAEQWKSGILDDWRQLYVDQGVSARSMRQAPDVFAAHFAKNLLSVHPVEGAGEVLRDARKAGLKIAILSNQLEPCLRSCIRHFGWEQYFDIVVAARGAKVPKSDPEALWGILRDLRLKPMRTILVEDMTQGINLGKAAGLVTVGKPSVLRQDLSAADFLVDDLRDVLKVAEGAAAGRLAGGGASREYRDVYERREREKSAGRITRLPDWYHSENLSFVRYLHRAVATPAPALAVDVGCGSSFHAMAMTRLFRCPVLRIDLTQAALRRGSALSGGLPGPASVQADAARLPLRDATSDLTLCAELLEHVPDPDAVLAELSRVTRPGGLLVLAVPNSVEATWPLFRGIQRKSFSAGHVREYTVDALAEAAERAGFHRVSLGSRWFLFYWLAFGVERSRLAAPAARALLRLRWLSRLTGRIVEELTFLETRVLGPRSRRGIGIFLIARKNAHSVHG
ncbi:HAD-IA family hydrolase [Streptomyces sp. NPDC005706]|uniref:HAD-IA family hydrolase n=1 Tax=Streptomyces sp. NPDC005706 TaxID=3157169 RepID=UPI0033DE4108